MPAEDCGYGPAAGDAKASSRAAPYASAGAGALNSRGYPLNPGSPICTHFQRTGTCKFGPTCYFDHPEDGAGGQMNSAGYPLNANESDCTFFMKTGSCKFGATCRFNHPEGVATSEAGATAEAAWGNNGRDTTGGTLNSSGYPLNSGQPDCSFFMKTGNCKFGATCRFNHPEGVATAATGAGKEASWGGGGGWQAAEAPRAGGQARDTAFEDAFAETMQVEETSGDQLNSAGYPLNAGQPDCSFYMKTGSCKFGATCRFNHPDGVATSAAQSGGAGSWHSAGAQGGQGLNSAGFPLNPGQQDCSFYMKTGNCKFGATCKFNHPDGVAASAAHSGTAGSWHSGGAQGGQGLNSGGYPMNPGQQDCTFYMKTGTCKFGATCRFNHPEGIAAGPYAGAGARDGGGGGWASAGGGGGGGWASEGAGESLNSAGYPLNPVQMDCAFYMKTGTCKFGGTCRFNHPEGVATMPAGAMAGAMAITDTAAGGGEALNSAGYPLNAMQPDCTFFMRTGSCKFGATCRFNHPEGLATSVAQGSTGASESGAFGDFQAAMQGAGATPSSGPRAAAMPALANGSSALFELNALGFPLRPHTKACQHYMQSGSCRLGAQCRWNHPANVGPKLSLEGLNSGGYPLNPGQLECAFYQRTGVCKFGATCFKAHPDFVGGDGGFGKPGAIAADAGAGNGAYAQRPGETHCAFFLKTGHCKFGPTCKFDHPAELAGSGGGGGGGGGFGGAAGGAAWGGGGWADAGGATLNSLGYPLRPGGTPCAFYLRMGQCKFGATCKNDHPEPDGGQGAEAAWAEDGMDAQDISALDLSGADLTSMIETAQLSMDELAAIDLATVDFTALLGAEEGAGGGEGGAGEEQVWT